MKRLRSLMDVTPVTTATTIPQWEPSPPGSTLVAWDAFRKSRSLAQARLYRTVDRCYLLYEECGEPSAMPAVHERVRRRILDRDVARTVYALLRNHCVTEEVAFNS